MSESNRSERSEHSLYRSSSATIVRQTLIEHERANEITIDAPVADGPIGPEGAQSKLAARLVEVDSDFTSGRREPNTFIRLRIDMKRAYTRFDEALTQTIQSFAIR